MRSLRNINDYCLKNTFIKRSEAREQLFNVMKYKVSDHNLLNKIINEVVNDRVEMKNLQQYWEFQHNEFKLAIQDKLYYINRKIH